MMSRCLVRGCRNGSGSTDTSVTFHPFPAERAAAERWAILCGVTGEECSELLKDVENGGSERNQLCSLHFEQEALEENPDDKTQSVKLRPGAEPTLLLTTDNNPPVNTSSPSARSAHSQAPPPASSCCSCTCAQSAPRTSAPAQVPDCGRLPGAEPGPQVSHCSTGATVVSPQPGVSQIVLNFCDQGRSVTLENVPPESAPPCQGGCHCLQRVVKQVVVIFLDHPRESRTPTSSPSSQESPATFSSGTQTGGKDGNSEADTRVHAPSSPRRASHQVPVHASTQTEPTATCTEGSEIQDPPEEMDCSSRTGEVPSSPGEQIHTSSDLSASESCERAAQSVPEPVQALDSCPQDDETERQAETKDPPPVPDEPPQSLEEETGPRCEVPTPNVEPAQRIDDQTPTPLRKSDPKPGNPAQPPLCPHSPKTCRQLCLDPSINQCVGDILEQYNVPSPPGASSAAVSSARCPCVSAQRCVKKIVLNFVEPQRAAVAPGAPSPCTSSAPVTSWQHQETQTADEFPPQTPKLQPKILPSPQRPPKSCSCPPLLIARTSPLSEEESSPAHPATDRTTPQDVRLESKVTYEDVAIYFSREEWELLEDGEKDLYREVMADNYQSLVFLGLLQEKPDLVVRIENEEENLWVNQEPPRRVGPRGGDLWFLDPDMGGVCAFSKDSATSPCAGRESVESSSHLGALMRLVNEIPGFLLGSSVTEGSCSPARSTEDHGSSRPFLEVKTEEFSLACSPASSHLPLSETPEMAAALGAQRKIVTKAEKAEVAVSQSSRYSTPVSHLPVSPPCIKSDPGSSSDSGRLQVKQEEFPARHPITPVKPIIAHLPKNPLYNPGTPEHVRRPCSAGGTSLSRSTAASPRNPSVSPVSPSHGANCSGLGDIKIKIKQEDSGSERDFAESPVYGRKVYHTATSSSSSSAAALQAEREHWRLAASPLRSPADVAPGSSPLHRLVNCLKEISCGRPRPYSSALSVTRWCADMSRVPAPQPNPFTIAVTNGAAQLRAPDSHSTRAGRDDSHLSNVPLSALGKVLEKLPSRMSGGQNIGVSPSKEDPRRVELGMKRTHSEDLSCRPGVFGGAKRPVLEASSYSRVVSSCSPGHRDLWRPPEELPRAPSEDQPIGNSHLMSVMNCVRKIPGYRPSPTIHVTSAADAGRPCMQGVVTEAKDVKVKQEKVENSPPEASRQWLQPPQSPDVPRQSGASATNVHLSGLMRLMEEIPCTDSGLSSRAMYSIAVGHSLARRMERSNHLSSGNDDSSFQAELNDSTIASVDSVYSDDTSWSSENVDPSYSAIGGLQRVVSEFAELGSVSPLVAVTAPPVSTVQDGMGLKKPKEASCASAPRPSENIRRSPRDAVGISASACSAENGEAAFAAIRGLQKVVHGFVEQECVSPITAVRNSTPNPGPRDCTGRRGGPDEEAASPRIAGSSPAAVSRFLCDTGKWLPEPDSSYSALSGLQKVVNGFSEMSCVSPFSAVSTPVSEGTMELSTPRRNDAPAPDFAPSGQKNAINGVPDAGCLSPLTVASTVSSESDPGPAAKRRCQRNDDDETSQKSSMDRQRTAAIAPGRNEASSARAGGSHCIDLTQEEEPACGGGRSATLDKERKTKTREGPPLCRPTEMPSSRPENPVGNRARPTGGSRIPCTQLIDLTEEEETLTQAKGPSAVAARKPGHTGLALNSPPAEKRRPSVPLPKPAGDKPLDPGASGSSRGGAVPAVNEHLSGLEKLLKGVPTFTPANRGSGQQAWSGSWWFKSTSSHET